MRERGVVDVLARVVLVQPHRAVVGERDVLDVKEVEGRRGGADVLDLDVPEPRGCRLGETKRHMEAYALPLAADVEAGLVEVDRAGTARTEQRDPRDALRAAAQHEIRRTSFQLVAEERVQHHVAAIDPPDRGVGVDLHREARRARNAEGAGGGHRRTL
jgi:hypothetical protein